MLRIPLTHPEILRALASAGHGARVLVADGNYPLSTASPLSASRVYLNLRAGCLTVTEVLSTLATVLPIESALCMQPPGDKTPTIFAEFIDILGAGVPIETQDRKSFYASALSPSTCLAIATGEQRRFANILLTLGTVRLPADVECYESHSLDYATPPLRP
ncbi:RbsD/FucU domain-containing protein [Opitutales bacterium ASA1]|uniref:RbsD/FucU family protein n=1 Tax=Congregicoccus parvus TaxID=3081749 RepID=UPI002B321A1B|nr:RbsD/FucU domain-containing protein [Opitutales bacterium ASA1]